MYSLTDYNYTLPEELIAQQPATEREQSRLLTLNRRNKDIAHCIFAEIHEILRPSDVLVVNNTEVVPARLFGKKETGGKAEVLILNYHASTCTSTFRCMVKSSKRPKPGTTIFFNEGLKARVGNGEHGIYDLEFSCPVDFESALYKTGEMPLPPYIRRNEKDRTLKDDRNRYQTVYASQKGAVAAPTAGLHFTKSLIEKIERRGIKIAGITLHVGYGTFLPVRVSDIREHPIHSEWFHIPEETARIINQAKMNHQRIIAVGTTTVRTLEYAANPNGTLISQSGECDLYIYPGYAFKIIDAMITNFHLPQSTLLMLVSAFAGRETILNAYQEAILRKYRFFSYGDAMFIE